MTSAGDPICTPGGGQATLLALDKNSGHVIWKSPIGDGAGYSSAVVGKPLPDGWLREHMRGARLRADDREVMQLGLGSGMRTKGPHHLHRITAISCPLLSNS